MIGDAKNNKPFFVQGQLLELGKDESLIVAFDVNDAWELRSDEEYRCVVISVGLCFLVS